MVVALFFSVAEGTAQRVEGYSFEDYPVGISKSKVKHKLDLKSYPYAKYHREELIEGYREGKIDFAGFYVTILGSCGSGCLGISIVDTRDGKIYDVPSGEEKAYVYCMNDLPTYDFPDERAMYVADSRLFITTHCTEDKIAEPNRYQETKTFFVNVWDEKRKKFKLIDTVKKVREFESKY